MEETDFGFLGTVHHEITISPMKIRDIFLRAVDGDISQQELLLTFDPLTRIPLDPLNYRSTALLIALHECASGCHRARAKQAKDLLKQFLETIVSHPYPFNYYEEAFSVAMVMAQQQKKARSIWASLANACRVKMPPWMLLAEEAEAFAA